jgi:glycerol-3-phosphate dehydrogenase (NAD+)
MALPRSQGLLKKQRLKKRSYILSCIAPPRRESFSDAVETSSTASLPLRPFSTPNTMIGSNPLPPQSLEEYPSETGIVSDAAIASLQHKKSLDNNLNSKPKRHHAHHDSSAPLTATTIFGDSPTYSNTPQNRVHDALSAAAAASTPPEASGGTLARPPTTTTITTTTTTASSIAVPFPGGNTNNNNGATNGTATGPSVVVYPPEERSRIRSSWNQLMRWSKMWRTREQAIDVKAGLQKVVVFGGGSFGTAMGACLARDNPWLQVTLLLRDPYLCKDINHSHVNTRYLKDWKLPSNVTATTSAAEAITGAQYAIHAVPVQHSRAFLTGIKDLIPPNLPLISVSKGLEVSSGQCMSELIPSALGRKNQPCAFLSGPSFASEVMAGRPTGIVCASKDSVLGTKVQQLFASPAMRVNGSSDVIGVEICGALKNVLAIAAGIVEGLNLGHNAMAALVAQGCAEIRWLAEKMGAKSATISGLSGLGDIMLTCYGSLSRNRSVGVRLGKGEALSDILSSSQGVAEGVATAGVVVSLAQRYRVQLPVLTAVAQVLDGHISAREAVLEIMRLPQIEER